MSAVPDLTGKTFGPDLCGFHYTVGEYLHTDEQGHVFNVTCFEDDLTIRMYAGAIQQNLGEETAEVDR